MNALKAAPRALRPATFITYGLIALGTLTANGASANCIFSQRTIRWSFPENNATNVATNADLLMIADPGCVATMLNGQPLTPTYPTTNFAYDLGDLAANTEYTVEFECPMVPGAPDPDAKPIDPLKFTTGTAPITVNAEPPKVPPPTIMFPPDMPPPGVCAEMEKVGTCYTGAAPPRYEFALSDKPPMWLIETSFSRSSPPKVAARASVCGNPASREIGTTKESFLRIHALYEDGTLLSGEWRDTYGINDPDAEPKEAVGVQLGGKMSILDGATVPTTGTPLVAAGSSMPPAAGGGGAATAEPTTGGTAVGGAAVGGAAATPPTPAAPAPAASDDGGCKLSANASPKNRSGQMLFWLVAAAAVILRRKNRVA